MADAVGMSKYVELFGDDFAPIINALENTLTPAVEAQVLNIMDDLTIRAEIFGKEIQRTITRMGTQGASKGAIKATLKRDMQTGGRLFSSLRNDVKEGIVEQINQSGRLGQMTEYKNANIFTWVTVQGHKVCPDCSSRSGMTMNWDDWVSEGLPASGWSVCKGHCYCVLDPSGKIPPTITAPTHVVEKGARGTIPKPFVPMTTKEATKLAIRKLRIAGAAEADITDFLMSMESSHRGKSRALEFKLKAKPSTIRKIVKESTENSWSSKAIVREDLNDLNRYTMLFSESKYSNNVLKTIKDMQDEGFKVLDIRNSWSSSKYRGLNCNFRSPNGQVFELQFHTPSSVHTKFKYSHPLYDEYRELATTAARKLEIEEELAMRWAKVNQPNGWESIKSVNNFKVTEEMQVYF